MKTVEETDLLAGVSAWPAGFAIVARRTRVRTRRAAKPSPGPERRTRHAPSPRRGPQDSLQVRAEEPRRSSPGHPQFPRRRHFRHRRCRRARQQGPLHPQHPARQLPHPRRQRPAAGHDLQHRRSAHDRLHGHRVQQPLPAVLDRDLVPDPHASYGFLQTLKPEDYVAIVAYDMRPEILSDFSDDKRKALRSHAAPAHRGVSPNRTCSTPSPTPPSA